MVASQGIPTATRSWSQGWILPYILLRETTLPTPWFQPLLPILDFWHPELWENKFMLFLNTKVLMICYGSCGKHMWIYVSVITEGVSHGIGRDLTLRQPSSFPVTWTYSQMNFLPTVSLFLPFGLQFKYQPIRWAFCYHPVLYFSPCVSLFVFCIIHQNWSLICLSVLY